MTTLPTWADLSDLDKGAALLHLHKCVQDGTAYAVEHYPVSYFEHPDLTVMGREDACRHAASLCRDVDALPHDEYERLYNLALEAEEREGVRLGWADAA